MAKLHVGAENVSSAAAKTILNTILNSGFGSSKLHTREEESLKRGQVYINRSSRRNNDWTALFSSVADLLHYSGSRDYSVILDGVLGENIMLPSFESVDIIPDNFPVSITFDSFSEAAASADLPLSFGSLKGKVSSLSNKDHALDHPIFTLNSRSSFGRILTDCDNYTVSDVFSAVIVGGSNLVAKPNYLVDLSSLTYHALLSYEDYITRLTWDSEFGNGAVYPGKVGFTKLDIAQFNAAGVSITVAEPDPNRLPFIANISAAGELTVDFGASDSLYLKG